MTTQKITFDASGDRFPVYAKYVGQHQPQPAYIELNTRTGELAADYSREIGNAVPMTVYHNIDLRWNIPATAKAYTIDNAIDCLIDLFQIVLDGHSEYWDGNNYVGQLTDDASAASEKIQRELDAMMQDDEGGLIESLAEWIEPQPFPAEGQSVEDFAAEVASSDGDDGWYFEHGYTDEEMLSELSDVWAEMLYAGKDIPEVVARHLMRLDTYN